MKKLLCIVLDGVGESSSAYGNAVLNARCPNLQKLRANHCFTTLAAHGHAVGLPETKDIGNSEVGHNAIGAGKIYDQGAKLVHNAIHTKKMFTTDLWKQIVEQTNTKETTLHFLGLLSDGNVHSHEAHLHAMLRQACLDGVKKVRVHILLDGRDVQEGSSLSYVEKLETVLAEVNQTTEMDYQIASGGGRMHMTMDRYEADWSMVERGWRAHVEGDAKSFSNAQSAIETFRDENPDLSDQYIPSFVIADNNGPIGKVSDGDAFVLFNFRGDRAIEISLAFTDKNLQKFSKKRNPDVLYAGMMQYDGDLKIPNNFLVQPPKILGTLSEHLIEQKLKLFACSETQKYGHVTYFWNGNNSGYIDKKYENHIEILSDNIPFDQKPEMKATEITNSTIAEMAKSSFDFGRINFANGDMVGHTGNYAATIKAMEVMDIEIGRLITAAKKYGYCVAITADHGNADIMFEGKAFDSWKQDMDNLKPKTAHTINPVPFYLYDPFERKFNLQGDHGKFGLGNLANCFLEVMGLQKSDSFMESFLEHKKN